jgi:hypothetical protein
MGAVGRASSAQSRFCQLRPGDRAGRIASTDADIRALRGIGSRMRHRLQIDVDQRAMDVVRHLRGSPEEVFGRPCGGYLMLMATEFETEAVAWLRHHVDSLDAVTGNEVAFAVFARTFTVPVGVPGSPAALPGRPRLDLAEVQDGGPWDGAVRRLVNRGRLGRLAGEDELTLVTPGTLETARVFGVAADLPCLVVVDALPGEQVDVIALRGADLDTLARVIRSSVQRVVRSPGLAAFLDTAGELARVEQRIRAAEAEAERLSGRLETLPAPDPAAEPVRRAYQRARDALSTGATRAFTTVLRQMWHPVPEKLIRAAGLHATEHRPELLRTDRTARTLAHYLHDFSWPLPEPQRAAYQQVLDRHVAPHCGVIADPGDPARCESLIAELRARNTAIVDTVVGTALPPLDVLVADVHDRVLSAAAALADRLHDAMADLEHLRTARQRLIEELAATGPPSLGAVLAEAARRAGLSVTRRTIADFDSAFTGAALSPPTLREVSRRAAAGH